MIQLDLVTAEDLEQAARTRAALFRTRRCSECGCWLRMTNNWDVCDPCADAHARGKRSQDNASARQSRLDALPGFLKRGFLYSELAGGGLEA